MARAWAFPALGIRTAMVLSHVLVLALPVVLFVASRALDNDLVEQRQVELKRQGALVAMLVEQGTGSGSVAPDGKLTGERGLAESLDAATLHRIHDETHAGVRILDRHGIVVASNGPRLGEDVHDRPEVAAALAGSSASAARSEVPPTNAAPDGTRSARAVPLPSPPHESRDWAFAATPVRANGVVIGAVLLARPARRPSDAMEDIAADLGPAAIVAALATLGLAWWSGSRLSRSLRALSRVADAMTDGKTDDRVPAHLTGTRVAEVRHLARAFEAMRGRLHARLRDNREFASNVSHEFRTPLATLRGTIEVLADDADMPDAQRARFRDNAMTDLDRLHRMVDGLLALARVEERGERAIVPLDDVVETVVSRHPGVRTEGDGGNVAGDAAQIELALENLVANALEHGGMPVVVRRWSDTERAGVDVVDAGAGISAANLGQIFDRFFTTSRERRGTGLGLALTRAICEAHGGGVSVQSQPGNTCFRAWWPRHSA